MESRVNVGQNGYNTTFGCKNLLLKVSENFDYVGLPRMAKKSGVTEGKLNALKRNRLMYYLTKFLPKGKKNISPQEFDVVNEYDNKGHHFIEKEGEQIVGGTKKVIRKIVEETWVEKPGYFNDGLGGTNVRTLTTDEIRDAFSDRFLGKLTEQRQVLTKINDNGRVSRPKKPFVLSKKVIREAANGHCTETKYAYGTGHRESRWDNATGQIYYNSNGLPRK